jgi:hypothetical protein
MPYLPRTEGRTVFFLALRVVRRAFYVLYLHSTANHSMQSSKNTIRYWMPFDQGQPRHITFSSFQKAQDMLAFYQGAGIRCEFTMSLA